MDELIDIVTEEGTFTGKSAPKSIIHTKGYYHNTAHIWFYTSNRSVLLAQRSKNKIICPLLWDVSVAGHVDAGESIEQAAIRETKEELGFLIKEKHLQKVGVFNCFQSYPNGIIDNEFHHTFIAKLPVDLSTITYNSEEVESIKLVTIREFKSLLEQSENNGHFIASNRKYYLNILSCIQNAT